MRRAMLPAAALLLVAAPAAAQIAPVPSYEDPRLQTVTPKPGQPVRLVAFPDAALTLVFAQGERIARVLVSDSNAFEVAVVGDNDSLGIRARHPAAAANLTVETDRQTHLFELETGRGLAAAYLVRLVQGGLAPELIRAEPAAPAVPESMSGTYRLTGTRELRPMTIGDDGSKTYIEWGEYQALPAVFGIGPTGDEEVVDGHMRGDVFMIDRVYEQLVFRMDKAKARARRSHALVSR